jgi:hypothetical protein
MSTIALGSKTLSNRFEKYTKFLAIILICLIPISTSALNIVLPIFMLSWFLSNNLKEKVLYIFQHPLARLCFILFGLFLVGTLYSKGSQSEIMEALSKMSKLLYLPFVLPLMREEKWRKYAFIAFTSVMGLTLILAILKMYAGVPIISRHTSACIFKNHIDTNLMMGLATFMLAHACSFPMKKALKYFLDE